MIQGTRGSLKYMVEAFVLQLRYSKIKMEHAVGE